MKRLPIKTNQEVAAEEYAKRIQKHLKKATGSWRKIAGEFAKAAEEFGFNSEQMKHLSKLTKFSKSKISKLISIQESERVKKHAKTFDTVNAWTTLYEVTVLSDDEFKALLESLAPGEVVTMADVNKVKDELKT